MSRVGSLFIACGILIFWAAAARPANATQTANRLTYLDSDDPFYPSWELPRLVTPQWVGETGVQAVVILAIDDMNEPGKWEKFLRPVLERLKQIDGQAPVSIMTVRIDVEQPQLQAWLREGLSIEAHTLTHPCPCLARSNFLAAAATYHDCVELLNRIPGNHPVAFRMPCCDSMNSPSPRFYAEIFNRTNAAGQFLTIDSSVMNITTTNDTALPGQLVLDRDGRERFRKYLPFAAFGTTIEDYPYPYVIGKLCWEFPAVVPSDWEAQHLHGTNNPVTVADWKAALDATVLKQGTMTLIFHPHNWIRNDQMVELIDYAVTRYGPKVKFLTFREAQARLDRNLLNGRALRNAQGMDGGVRLLDLNSDGYMDVISANEFKPETRIWNPQKQTWTSTSFPFPIVPGDKGGSSSTASLRFGIIHPDGRVSAVIRSETVGRAWTFDGRQWVPDDRLLTGLELDGHPVFTVNGARDRGVRFRDIDGDGQCECIVGNDSQNAVFRWAEQEGKWIRLRYSLPSRTSIVDERGRDNGLRFVDINKDGFDDVLFSNEKAYSLHLFIPRLHLGFQPGWSREVLAGQRGESDAIPMISREGSNNGAWFHAAAMWVQNEDTASLTDKVERVSFERLLGGLQPRPLSPEESLKAIHLKPGFKAELVAHEPLVQDPVAFEWGADGKLWVVEMGDYPLGEDGRGKPGGRIRFLEDTNHDGIYDRSTVFLEGLNFPTGVALWRKGIIVSAAPEIFYAEDTDGDGKADVRNILFRGFVEGNQQHRVNGFDYGLDGWLYGANGDSGGSIRSESQRGKAVDIRGQDFRFNPNDGSFEALTGGAQFGRHRDDWGNWFGNNNSTWLWHCLIPARYLARSPHVAVPKTRRLLAQYPEGTRVFPISRHMQRFNDIGMSGHVTSANSATPYRDELFGSEFETSVFVSEPVHNLVHREVLEREGASFVSHRGNDETTSEFLASTDNWFRPTMIRTGPDGALYIADMYRLVIEHPEWIPEDVKQHLNLRAGHDKGRLYRVYPITAPPRPIANLNTLDTTALVAAMDSPNGWQRDTVQRLLIERGDPNAIRLLSDLAAHSQRPRTRLQALCTLEVLGALTVEDLKVALHDTHEKIRQNAVHLAEQFLEVGKAGQVATEKSKEVGSALVTLADDPDVAVRYQLALTLGEWDDPKAAEALAKLAVQEPQHADILLAVQISVPRHLATVMEACLAMARRAEPPQEFLASVLGMAASMGDEHALAQALQNLSKSDGATFAAWQFTALAGLLDALEQRGQSLKQVAANSKSELRSAILGLEPVFTAARASLPQPGQTYATSTVTALRLLGRSSVEDDRDLDRLGSFLPAQYPAELQSAALAGLRRLNTRRAAEVLLLHWPNSSPSRRGELLDTLLARREWTSLLLDAIEQNRIPANQIEPAQQEKLRRHSSAELRKRAEKLFARVDPDRKRVIEAYDAVPGLPANREQGAALFEKNCATCHAPHGRQAVGPDLNALASKPVTVLIESILDPNRAVEARYVAYTAITRGEREFSGIIVDETPNSLTLRSATSEETILRNDCEKLTSSGLSLMPEGFEHVLSPQDLADIIAFIQRK